MSNSSALIVVPMLIAAYSLSILTRYIGTPYINTAFMALTIVIFLTSIILYIKNKKYTYIIYMFSLVFLIIFINKWCDVYFNTLAFSIHRGNVDEYLRECHFIDENKRVGFCEKISSRSSSLSVDIMYDYSGEFFGRNRVFLNTSDSNLREIAESSPDSQLGNMLKLEDINNLKYFSRDLGYGFYEIDYIM